MASPIRKKNASVIDRLIRQPHRFQFYQAVRLLLARGVAGSLGAPDGRIGTTGNASNETLRFRSLAALRFPTSELKSVRVAARPGDATTDTDSADDEGNSDHALTVAAKKQPVELEVSFWGLTGPLGVLPNHYTQLVIDRARQKDHCLHDFLDLFSHRQLSFFYRAWEKTFIAGGCETAIQTGDPSHDQLRTALLALIGLGTSRVQNRLSITDETRVYYGGLFIDRPNAESLRQLVADHLGHTTEVLSLFGQWLRLPPREQSQLGALGGHCSLGRDTVLGERIWDAPSKFRLRVGPVTYDQFSALMPTGTRLPRLCQLVRSYVGCEYSFDVQVILLAAQTPSCRLGGESPDRSGTKSLSPSYLGWNTWMSSRPPTRDSQDAVFEHGGAPTC